MAYGIALIVSGSRGNRLLFLCTETGTTYVVNMHVMTILIIDKLNGEYVSEALLK